MAMTQMVIEKVVESNPNVFVLKFRFPEKGVETPRFVINARNAKSYTKWNISMMPDFASESLEETKELFKEAIRSSKFEFVLGECKNSEIDGELLAKLIQLSIWVETIRCDSPEFFIEDKDISTHNPAARKVSVTMA